MKRIRELEDKIECSKKENDPEDHKMYAKSWERKISQLQKKIKAIRQEKGRNACVKFAYTHFKYPCSIVGDEFYKNP